MYAHVDAIFYVLFAGNKDIKSDGFIERKGRESLKQSDSMLFISVPYLDQQAEPNP